MTSIWKFKLSSSQQPQTLKIPSGGVILHSSRQEPDICLWVEVNENNEFINRDFLVIGTGWEVPQNSVYIGTVFDGSYVWHIYAKDLK